MKRYKKQKSLLKIFSFALIFSLILMSLSVHPIVNAADATVIGKGSCGEDARWTLSSDGMLIIYGTGEMSFSSAPWQQYREKITTLVIEDGITKIAESAFNDYPSLKRVIIHGTVEFFDDMAFSFCSGIESVYFDSIDCLFGATFSPVGESNPLANIADLYIDSKPATEITVPSYVKNIGMQLTGGRNIRKITIPSGVVSIDGSAFIRCEALESITIPDTVTSIGYGAFLGCYQLKKIEIPDSVKTIGSSAFRFCYNLEEIKLPRTLDNINENTFEDCRKLKSIVLPDKITMIGPYAFSGCKAIKSISIPATVERIGAYAFSGCESLKSISLHPSVKAVRDYAFDGCGAFTDIYFYGTLAQWHEVKIVVNAYNNRQTKVSFVNCAHKNTTVAPMEKPTSFYPGYTQGVFCNDCNKFISGRQEIPKTDSPFTNSDSAKLIGDMIYVLPGVSYSALVAHSDPGSYILISAQTGLSSDKLPGTGMTLAGLNGLRNTIIVMGDADGDGKATASDARLALRLSVGLEHYKKDSLEYKALNVNGGEIEASDARAILRASVSIEKLELPAGG